MSDQVPGWGSPSGFPASPTADERTWALLAHLGAILVSFVAPLVVLLTKGKESAFVRDQATESLNFQITVIIAYAVSAVLALILVGLLLMAVVIVGALVFEIIAGIQAYSGVAYRYPINWRLVK